MNELQKLPKIIHHCMTLGEIPTSYKASLSYAEQLTWFCHFLETQVIPVVNNNSQVVQELQTFITDYFDNLDVQDEINNKLEAMAESGELQEIIDSYINLKSMLVFDTVADMKEATNLVNGSYAETLGYYEKNDGGASKYFIREVTNEDDVDESFIIALDDVTLVAVKVENDEYNVLQYGVKRNINTDQSTKIQHILDITRELYFPRGEYTFSITLNYWIAHIRGDGMEETIFKAPNTTSSPLNFNIQEGRNMIHSTFEKFIVKGNWTSTVAGINLTGAGILSLATFRNVCVYGFKYGFKSNAHCWSNSFENCAFSNNTDTGFMQTADSKTFNNNTFLNCRFISNVQRAIDIYVTTGRGFSNSFIGCDIEQNTCDDTEHSITSTASETIILGGDNTNTLFESCYFEKNGYTRQSGYNCTLWLYKETGSKVTVELNNCNITLEQAFIRLSPVAEALIINCIERDPQTNKFMYNNNGNYIFVGGSYVNNIYDNSTKVLNAPSVYKAGWGLGSSITIPIPNKVAFVELFAFSGDVTQKLKLAVFNTNVKEIENTSTNTASINYSYSFDSTTGILTLNNGGSSNNSYMINVN